MSNGQVITTGDWQYVPRQGVIFYRDFCRIETSSREQSLLVGLILQKKLSREQISFLPALRRQLQKILPGAFFNDSFQQLLDLQPPYLPWQIGEDGLVFQGRKLKDVNPKSSSDFQAFMIKAMMERYPSPVSMRALIKEAYGTSNDDMLSRRRMRGRIDIFNTMLIKHFSLKDKPILYVEDKDGYILNIPLREIKKSFGRSHTLRECGELTISMEASQIWFKGRRIQNIGSLEWSIVSVLMQRQGRYIPTSEINAELFGEGQKEYHQIQQAIKRFRAKVDDISPSEGKKILSGRHSHGYGLFDVAHIKRQRDLGLTAPN